MGQLAEFLPGMHITDMDFYHRRLDSGNSISNGHRRMRVTTRIKDNAVERKTRPLQLIDQLPFHIALKVMEGDCRVFLLQLSKILFKGLIAIYLRFACPQQVQVRAVDDRYMHINCISLSMQ